MPAENRAAVEARIDRAIRRGIALSSAPPGQWVALSADESQIVAVGESFLDVVRQADALGLDDPLIAKIPED